MATNTKKPLTTYSIAPARWSKDGSGNWHWATVFGSMTVEQRLDDDGECDPDRWCWTYCFDEYYDEESFDCDSAADGKRKAWAFYLERLLPALKAIEVSK